MPCPPADNHLEVRVCVLAYLDLYLDILLSAVPLPDAEQCSAVRQRREQFVRDLVTQDRAQKALGCFIGKNRLGLFQQHVIG